VQTDSEKPCETPFDSFTELARKLVRVPKKEVKQKQAAYSLFLAMPPACQADPPHQVAF
jgi:hypothetical protein